MIFPSYVHYSLYARDLTLSSAMTCFPTTPRALATIPITYYILELHSVCACSRLTESWVAYDAFVRSSTYAKDQSGLFTPQLLGKRALGTDRPGYSATTHFVSSLGVENHLCFSDDWGIWKCAINGRAY